LEKPDHGEIRIAEKVVNEVPPSERDIAMVFQNYALYPHKTVFDNIAIGLKLRKYPAETIRQRVHDVSQMLGIGGLLGRYPKQLSGGQQQMLAVARALVPDNKLLLIDEPSEGLAPVIIEQMMDAIRRLSADTTIVLVEQNFIVASQLAERYVIIEEGRSVQAGQMADLIHDQATIHRYLGAA